MKSIEPLSCGRNYLTYNRKYKLIQPWIDNLNKGKINNSLAKCYGHPEFLKGHGTANEVNFGFILKDAYSVYVNFPEVNYDR